MCFAAAGEAHALSLELLEVQQAGASLMQEKDGLAEGLTAADNSLGQLKAEHAALRCACSASWSARVGAEEQNELVDRSKSARTKLFRSKAFNPGLFEQWRQQLSRTKPDL